MSAAATLDALLLEVILVEVLVEDVDVHWGSIDEADTQLVLQIVSTKVDSAHLLLRSPCIASDSEVVLQLLPKIGYLLELCLHLLIYLLLRG